MPVVGYWNVQRATNPDARNEVSGGRFGLMHANIRAWIEGRTAQANTAPDAILLAEVTQTGNALAASFNADFGTATATHAAYTARFLDVVGHRSRQVSPCSFLVLSRTALALTPELVGGGESVRRPYVRLRLGTCVVAGVHLIANREKSAEECLIMCEDVFPNPQPSMVLGDMNFRLDHLTPRVMAPFTRAPLNFTATAPGMPATYKGRYVLDYCLSEPGVAATQVTPFPNYSDWEDIDHAPIAYRIS